MDFRRLFDILPYQKARYPNAAALRSREGMLWRSWSTDDCLAAVDRVSAGLLDLGLQRGDKVAIMTYLGSPAWNFLDFGMQQIGVVVVPVHAAATQPEVEFILRDAEVKYCIVSSRELYERVQAVRPAVLSLREVFTLQYHPDLPYWEDQLTEPDEKHLEAFQGLRASVHEEDLATIIYTSGTTGEPKGVMLSHKNIVSNIKSIITLIPINCDKRTLSFLPLSHIFERMVVYTYLAVGASVSYVRDRDRILEYMRTVRPHYFTAVPRFLEQMLDWIMEEADRRSILTRRLVRWAIRLGERYDGRRMSLSYWFQLRLANLLVFQHWRRLLGGKVEGVVVGAAPLQPRLGRLFSAAGLEVREGYGLTETAPVVAFNRFEPGGLRFGTVGIPAPGVEVRIDQPDSEGQGEILVRGPNVMLGYYQREADTRAVLSEEGWLRTGDVGRFVHKRFLQITDRKKDIFKTTTGKYVAPQRVENELKTSPYIEQCVVLGAGRPFPAALIIPCFPLLQQWCEAEGVHWTAPQFMVINPRVEQLLQSEVDRINEGLASHERVRKFTLLHQPWTETRGELTPTLKNRRNVLFDNYQKEIASMYDSP